MSVIHLKVIFVYGLKYGLKFIFLYEDIQLFQHFFVEEVTLSPQHCLCTFAENQYSPYFCGHISGLFFFFSFIFICWRLITLQHCSGFCHTLK